MQIDIPPKIRAALYVVTALGTPIVGYLLAKDIIGALEVSLWGAEVTVVSTMAAFKVSK
jgi:hypothetical protein